MPARLRQVAPGIEVATSRLDSMNTVLVLSSDRASALLVDPGWAPDELDALADEITARSITVVAGFSTHAHYDHVLWHPGFGAAVRWASAETALRSTQDRDRLLAELGPGYRDDVLDLFSRLTALRAAAVPWDGPLALAVTHDAHMPGHTALWLEDARVLIAGDMLSDIEPPLLDDTPGADPVVAVAQYRAGLDVLAPYAARAHLVIPGHGTPGTDALARLERDRRALAVL